jgi:hypothetical protein
LYEIFINNNSYTGGEFKNNIDNDNFISLINTFINKYPNNNKIVATSIKNVFNKNRELSKKKSPFTEYNSK